MIGVLVMVVIVLIVLMVVFYPKGVDDTKDDLEEVENVTDETADEIPKISKEIDVPESLKNVSTDKVLVSRQIIHEDGTIEHVWEEVEGR